MSDNPYAPPAAPAPNPYAAPAADVQAALGKPGRIGIPPDVELPPVCAMCGSINEVSGKERRFSIPNALSIVFLFLFLGFVFYRGWPLAGIDRTGRGVLFLTLYGVQYLVGQKRRQTIPLCVPCHSKWDWARRFAIARSAVFVVGMLAPTSYMSGPVSLAWIGIVLFTPSLTRRWQLQVTMVAGDDKKFDKDRLWLLGVNETAREAYLDAFPGRVRG